MNRHKDMPVSNINSSAAEHCRYSFEAIATPASHAYQQSMALLLLPDDMQDCRSWGPESYLPKAIAFLVDEVSETLRELDARHLELHNTGCALERREA